MKWFANIWMQADISGFFFPDYTALRLSLLNNNHVKLNKYKLYQFNMSQEHTKCYLDQFHKITSAEILSFS